MNKEQIAGNLRTVVCRVLEDAVFIFAEDLDESEKPKEEWDAEGASISFKGEATGVFRLWVDRSFAPLLAANMLGVEPEQPGIDRKGEDALREFLNIIAGNALTAIFGDSAVFSLSIPEKADEGRKESDYSRTDGVWLSAEEHRLLCVLDIEQEKPQ